MFSESVPIKPNVLHTAQILTTFLKKHGIEHVVVGGLAVKLHGGPRNTDDVDVSVESFSFEVQEAMRAELGFDVRPHPTTTKPGIWLVTAPACTVSRSCFLRLLTEAQAITAAQEPESNPQAFPPSVAVPYNSCNSTVDLPCTMIDIAVRSPFVQRTERFRKTVQGVSGIADERLLIANKVHTVVDRPDDNELPAKVRVDIDDLMSLSATITKGHPVSPRADNHSKATYPTVMLEVLTEAVWAMFFMRAVKYSSYTYEEITAHLRKCGLGSPPPSIHDFTDTM